jgi:hypothetical protein
MHFDCSAFLFVSFTLLILPFFVSFLLHFYSLSIFLPYLCYFALLLLIYTLANNNSFLFLFY